MTNLRHQHRRAGLPLALLLAAGLAACESAPVGEAGVVAFGRVWTGNPDQPWAGGVAMRGDTILAVGDSGDLARYVGAGTEVVTAAGGMVVPGFMDGHTHFHRVHEVWKAVS